MPNFTVSIKMRSKGKKMGVSVAFYTQNSNNYRLPLVQFMVIILYKLPR